MKEKKSGTKINSFYAKRYNKNIAGKSSTLGDGTLTEGLTAKHKMKLVLNAIKKNFVKKTKISLVDFGGVYGSMRLFKENLGAKVYSVNVTAEQLVDCENKIICDITKKVPLPRGRDLWRTENQGGAVGRMVVVNPQQDGLGV